MVLWRCSIALPVAGFSVATAGLLLVVQPGGAEAGLALEHKWQSGIQVWQSSSKGRDVMWGQCKGWFRKLRSCILQETTCAAHLSQGPADADIEVRIGNLPFFRNHETYLQWWAARKSKDAYDPFTDPDGAQVYPSMFEAYPRFSDADFNGGNVRINSDGTAVIRFRAPAAHQVHKHIRIPHVHLRICSGGSNSLHSIILGRKDKIQLTPQGPVAKSECNSAENKLSVLTVHRLQHDFTPASAAKVAVAVAAALKPLVARGVGRLVSGLTEEFDLDVLEFSPVFQCLSAGLLYDHFAGDCVAACPAGAAVSRGQCVKRAAVVQSSSFAASWQLYICGCDEKCWADKRNGTLHRLRLEIADHLDIPLHEVQELDLRFESRGWSPHRAAQARMHVRISSPRYTADTGVTMLRNLFRVFLGPSEVLAMLVLGAKEIPENSAFLQKHSGAGGISTEDPFAPYYHDLEMAKAEASNDDPLPADKPTAQVAHAPPFVVGSALAMLAALALPSLLILALFSKYCHNSISVEAGEPMLRRFGEPLAANESVQHPRMITGVITAACSGIDGSTVKAPQQPQTLPQANNFGALVPAYLAAVYARALQGAPE